MLLLKVSDLAVEKIKEELEGISPDVKEPFIRLYMSVGWGGPSLQLALDESTNSEDTVTEVDGVKFVIHSSQSYYFDNVQLDYKEGMFGGGYRLVDL